MRELALVNIRGRIEHLAKHIRVNWIINGEQRNYTTAASPSDVRGKLNARADVRRMLRNDGAYNQINGSKLAKALEVPVLVAKTNEPIEERMKRIEEEIAALIDVVFEIRGSASPELKQLKISKKGYLLEYLSKTEWKTVAELVKETGKEYVNLSSTLNYMKRAGKVEHDAVRHGWRLK